MRITEYRDLMEMYECPMDNTCDMHAGQTFIADGWKKPEGLCDSAWETMSPFVLTLACGGMLVKRPLLITDKGVYPGFKEEIWESLL